MAGLVRWIEFCGRGRTDYKFETAKALCTVAWDGDRVLVPKIRFRIDDIRMIVHGLSEDASQRFKNELMLADGNNVTPQLDRC